MSEEPVEETIISWSGITATLIVAVAQTAVFYLFFLHQRSKEKAKNDYSLYEPRQFAYKHRSPSPFGDNWIKDAWSVPPDVLRDNVGLDTFMYLRFLRLGARIAAMGVAISAILIPVYATGSNTGDSTIQFNQLTLARVSQGSNRMWATVMLWWCFIFFVLYEFWTEWNMYRDNRTEFLAKGDPDIPKDSRYAVRVEQLPKSEQSDRALTEHFEGLFPNMVRQANVFVQMEPLDKAIAERQGAIVQVEKAVAFTKARPEKRKPPSKVGGMLPCLGQTVDTIDHYSAEIERLVMALDFVHGI